MDEERQHRLSLRTGKYEEPDSSAITASPKLRAISGVAAAVGFSTLAWAEKDTVSVDVFTSALHQIPKFVSDLFDALTVARPSVYSIKNINNPDDYKNSYLRWWLWAHIGSSVWCKDINYRENFIRADDLTSCVSQYLKNPWWHNDYLDWVLLDSLVGADLLASVDILNRRKFGIAYDFAQGTIWKARLLNAILRPASIILGWVAPGFGFYKLSAYSVSTALVLAGVYYFWSVYLLLQWIQGHITHIIKFKKTSFGALRDMLVAKSAAYDRLGSDTIHVPSLRKAMNDAAGAGVVWSSQVLCLLDEVESKHKVTWLPSDVIEKVAPSIWRMELSSD